MTKQFTKWSANIAIFNAIIIVTLTLFSGTAFAAAADAVIPAQGTITTDPTKYQVAPPASVEKGPEPTAPLPDTVAPKDPPSFLGPQVDNAYPTFDTGTSPIKTIDDATSAKYGSSGALNKYGAQPITSDERPLETISGSQTGSAQMSAASSKEFLLLMIQPLGSGDANLTISQDTNFDGVLDTTVNANGISGACADGYVKCDPGTWIHCYYHQWDTDNGLLMTNVSPINNLSGCYCFNNSCGANLVNKNLTHILNHLGGGAAGALIRENPAYQISKAEVVDAITIKYYGQDLGSGRANTDGSIANMKATESKWFKDAGGMVTSGETTFATQTSDPKSFASMSVQMAAQSGTSITTTSCQIDRTMIMSTETEICDSNTVFDGVKLESLRTKIYYKVQTGTWGWNGDDDHCSQWIPHASRIPPGIPIVAAGPPADSTLYAGDVWILDWCDSDSGADDGHYFIVDFWEHCTDNYDILKEEVTSNCLVYENDPDCRILSETVDGVQIMQGGVLSGLSPLPSTRSFTGQYAIYPVGRDWWHKNRTYECTTKADTSLNAMADRVRVIEESTDTVESTATQIPYSDSRTDAGNIYSESGTVQIPNMATGDMCQKACKIQRITSNTDAALASTADDYRAGGKNEITQITYATCLDSDGDGNYTECPLGAGETMIKNCSCIDDFAETSAILEMLNRAGKDLICSDGVKK
jgi:hypothetical protein